MKRVLFCACAVVVILVSANGCALSPTCGSCDGGCATLNGSCDSGPGYASGSHGSNGSRCSNCGMAGAGGLMGCPHCGLFARARGIAGHRQGHPYGQITPHPAHGYPGPAGPTTAAYAYPYYTVRAPRDFLVDNPPSIGR